MDLQELKYLLQYYKDNYRDVIASRRKGIIPASEWQELTMVDSILSALLSITDKLIANSQRSRDEQKKKQNKNHRARAIMATKKQKTKTLKNKRKNK